MGKKYSKTSSAEKREIATLNSLLNEEDTHLLTQLTNGDDKFPDVDGYIHLLTDEFETSGHMLKVQIKSLKKNKIGPPSVTCDKELLEYSQSSSVPILLVGVDSEDRVAHWIYLSPELAKRELSEMIAKGTQNRTFRLSKHNIIKSGNHAYTLEWKRICLHHRNVANDKIVGRYKRRVRESGLENDSAILERLKTLQSLVFYRTNNGEYPLIEVVMEMQTMILHTSRSVKIAYVELIGNLVYTETLKSLEILTKMLSDEDEFVRNKVIDTLLEVTKYDINILNTFGYLPYRAVLDFLELGNIPTDLLCKIQRNILDPDYGGTTRKDVQTYTIHSGPLNVSPFLQKIRGDAINLLFKRYWEEKDLSQRVKIIDTIGYATYNSDSPIQTEGELLENSLKMVETDTERIIGEYEKILFPDGELIKDYPIVYEIETQLSILCKRGNPIRGVSELVKRIRSAKGDYRLYSILAGDEMRLRRDINWREGEKLKGEEIEKILASMSLNDASEWFDRINYIAGFKGTTEDWLFNTLRSFLIKLTELKPEVAKFFTQKAFEEKGPLLFFLPSLFWGFRQNSLSEWDKYAQLVIDEKLSDQVGGLLLSIQAKGLEDEVRKEDIEMILDITNRSGKFSFLKEVPFDISLEYRIFEALVFTSLHDSRIHNAIVKKFKDTAEMKAHYMERLSFALHQKWINLSTWDKRTLNLLADQLVNIDRLDYDALEVLTEIGEIDFELIMSVFERRIKHPFDEKYHAIPFDLRGEITDLISSNIKTKQIVSKWLKQIDSEKDYMQSFHLSEFMERIGGDKLRAILLDLIATGTKENIMRVLETMPSSEPADLELCLEIVKVTDDEEIIGSVASRMCFAGGGTGSYGENIFGRELRKVETEILRLKKASTDEKIINFCEDVLAKLAQDILKSDENHQKRMREDQDEFDAEHNDNV